MEYLLGLILQYLRSFKNFKDWYALAFAVVGAVVCFWVSPEGRAADFRGFIEGAVPYILRLLGVTQLTSTGANIAVTMGVSESSPLVPVTDSNG